jgi:transcription elongation factor Elf1
MTAKCDQCAFPPGETTCVTCGAEMALVPVNPESTIMKVQEGVQVEPAVCGKCGRMTVSRIESHSGEVGCLDCLMNFIIEQPKLPPV